ncbi:MAG: hypothetical protein EOP84_01405, partial [Verrucomicrobiaceae bacterium]
MARKGDAPPQKGSADNPEASPASGPKNKWPTLEDYEAQDERLGEAMAGIDSPYMRSLRKAVRRGSKYYREVQNAAERDANGVQRLPETDFPRSLRSDDHRRHRREMLTQSHMLPLNEFVSRLRRQSGVEVPDFDPMDGGVRAKMLFL